ncbi:MAG: hypothetical protein WBM99_16235, partial [Psychromonas sp.]
LIDSVSLLGKLHKLRRKSLLTTSAGIFSFRCQAITTRIREIKSNSQWHAVEPSLSHRKLLVQESLEIGFVILLYSPYETLNILCV